VVAQDAAGGEGGYEVADDSGADPEGDDELKCGHGVFSIVVGCEWHAATASSVGLVRRRGLCLGVKCLQNPPLTCHPLVYVFLRVCR